MNTHGHHGVADEAGLPLLRAAFGGKDRSLGTFYLGNWLTDLSQAIDPVAYEAARDKAAAFVSAAIDPIMQTYADAIDQILAGVFAPLALLPGDNRREILRTLRQQFDMEDEVATLKQDFRSKLEVILQGRSETRDSMLGEFFRNALLFVAYFKFVFPEHEGEEDRIDFESFMRVFGRPGDTKGSSDRNPANDRPGAYTQYYPHEHLDRPQIADNPRRFAPGAQVPGRPFRVAKDGPEPGPRSISGAAKIEPDLYSYLRDNIECTAGLLAEVDVAFSRALARGVDETDPEWHITLAKLGHALHQVEDFFAHSNWIELAARKLGPDFLDTVFPPETGIALLDDARTIFDLRLTRYVDPPDRPVDSGAGPRPEPEDWVVTGYFDTMDTLVSLAHIAEETLGLKVPDPWTALDRDAHSVKDAYENREKHLERARTHLRESLDLVTRPDKVLKDPANGVARQLAGKLDDLEEIARPPAWLSRAKAERIAREIPLIANAPPEILAAFVNAVSLGGQISDVAGAAGALYDQITDVVSFVTDPVGYVTGWLTDAIGERAAGAVKYVVKERIYEQIGSRRIGCHSLLAKDHGLEPLYEHQRQCATAVHWYVVSTLLRDRADPDSPAFVDWLELLEFFLRNPLDPAINEPRNTMVYRMVVTERYVTRKGDQLDCSDPRHSLAKRFRRTAADPRSFDWRTIADANFGTVGLDDARRREVINAALRDRSWGVPVRPPNYALKPGVVLNIPQQVRELRVPAPSQESPEWWVQILQSKSWLAFRGLDSGGERRPARPSSDHTLRAISEEEHASIILRGQRLRRYLRGRYRPLDGPGGLRSRPGLRTTGSVAR